MMEVLRSSLKALKRWMRIVRGNGKATIE